jgi:hypothetical protein
MGEARPEAAGTPAETPLHVIRFVPPSQRYLSLNDVEHWRRKAERVKAWRWAAQCAVLNQLPPRIGEPVPMVVQVSLPVKTRHRRDPINYTRTVKAIVDGLVASGRFWPDDTPEFVTDTIPELRYCYPQEDDRVWVSLTPR